MDITNILTCGVGGQGILLAGEILSLATLKSGFDVKKSEIHGMAQRGGSVVSHIRFGEKVYSPTIKEGTVDFLFSFEKMETLRYLPMLKKEGAIIINDQKISPTSTNIKSSHYPENIEETCRRFSNKVISLNALKMAEEIGNTKTVNVIMIGALSKFLKIDEEIWISSLKDLVKEKFLNINIKAFQMGRTSIN